MKLLQAIKNLFTPGAFRGAKTKDDERVGSDSEQVTTEIAKKISTDARVHRLGIEDGGLPPVTPEGRAIPPD